MRNRPRRAGPLTSVRGTRDRTGGRTRTRLEATPSRGKEPAYVARGRSGTGEDAGLTTTDEPDVRLRDPTLVQEAEVWGTVRDGQREQRKTLQTYIDEQTNDERWDPLVFWGTLYPGAEDSTT